MSASEGKTNKTPYQKYLEKRHGSFETPEVIIGKMVKKATGFDLVQKSRIIAGEVNEVYDVVTKDSKNAIVRISRQGKSNFEVEEKIIRLARMEGVPAPKVLLIEEASSDSENLTFCVEEKIEGETLSKLMGFMDRKMLQSIVSEAGEILSKINAISVDSFGPLDGLKLFKTWVDYLLDIEKRRDEIIIAGKIVGIEANSIDRAYELLSQNKSVLQIEKPYLLHADFGPKHLLVLDNRIVGVLDFESAKGGDPVQDLARIDFFYSRDFPIDWLKGGYKNKDIFDKNFDLKMKLYRLHLGLGLLDYYHTEKNESGLNHTKRRFLEDLKTFLI